MKWARFFFGKHGYFHLYFRWFWCVPVNCLQPKKTLEHVTTLLSHQLTARNDNTHADRDKKFQLPKNHLPERARGFPLPCGSWLPLSVSVATSDMCTSGHSNASYCAVMTEFVTWVSVGLPSVFGTVLVPSVTRTQRRLWFYMHCMVWHYLSQHRTPKHWSSLKDLKE